MLPPLYAGWMTALLGAPIPEEGEATCDHCAMQVPAGVPADPEGVYFTEGKCCTYQPALYSFLVGRILSDDAEDLAAARAAVERLIDARAGVTPYGVLGPRSYWALYGGADAFGRSGRLRCPLFQVASGRCGIWRHRESTCATWFCKHDRGAVGLAFWTSLHQLLEQLERSLASWCIVELAPGSRALAAAFAREEAPGWPDAADLDGGANDVSYARAWGRYLGREREYYRLCEAKVAALGWPEVLGLGGAEARALVALVQDRFEALCSRSPVPGPLRLGRFEQASSSAGYAALRTYRHLDPLEVPLALLGALARFDGRPTAEVLAEIAARDGVTLAADELRTLCDFEVLVARDASP